MNAVVTGATKGIGRAITVKLAEAGYNLVICSRSQLDIDSLCRELASVNPSVRAIGLSTNCAQPSEVNNFANFVKQHFDKVDVLINNVGLFYQGSILDEEDFILDDQLNVNFKAAYTLCKVFGRQMRDNKSGYIINICSIAALQPVKEAGSYTVTKFALYGLTKVLRLELMQHNVKVTAIIPGSTFTDSWKGTEISKDKFIGVEDIANAVMYCLATTGGANADELIITPSSGQI